MKSNALQDSGRRGIHYTPLTLMSVVFLISGRSRRKFNVGLSLYSTDVCQPPGRQHERFQLCHAFACGWRAYARARDGHVCVRESVCACARATGAWCARTHQAGA